MAKEIKNCSNCGKWCEHTVTTGFFYSPFPLNVYGLIISTPFCCAFCRDQYYSTRPIRRLFRKASAIWNTVLILAFFVVASFNSKADLQTTSNNASTERAENIQEETKVAPSDREVLKWTSNDGKVIEAQFMGLQGDNVLLKVQSTGVTHTIPLTRLSSNSQNQAKASMK
jgi:hypothetical protein